MSDRKLVNDLNSTAHLGDARMRAVYISDAFASGIADEVAQALHIVDRKGRFPDDSAKNADQMTLGEVMEILQGAGVQLVAIRRPDS